MISLLTGLAASLFFGINTLFWSLLLYVVLFFRIVLPFPATKRFTSRVLVGIGESWCSCNAWALDKFMRVRWNVTGIEGLRRDVSYLICANHRSWVDIVVLQYIFNRRIPFLRFFIKKELLYVPLLGGAWWALDFPVMKRHSREYLAKHPEKRGEDLRTTRRACERFRGSPVSILNFLEGTRFTEAKHRAQSSPYRHLLKPKTGGVFFVIEAMGSQFESVLDVTLYYPDQRTSLWDLLSGKVRRVEAVVRSVPIPPEFVDRQNSETRQRFHAWIHELWSGKDQLLDRLEASVTARSAGAGATPPPARP